jgi:hypothetical protein
MVLGIWRKTKIKELMVLGIGKKNQIQRTDGSGSFTTLKEAPVLCGSLTSVPW